MVGDFKMATSIHITVTAVIAVCTGNSTYKLNFIIFWMFCWVCSIEQETDSTHRLCNP
jgi:hypothetical protein